LVCRDSLSEYEVERVRQKILHGMNRQAWKRYTSGGSWFYEITERGYKYNLTDIAAALGIVQLKKIDRLAEQRNLLLSAYREALLPLAEWCEIYKPWKNITKTSKTALHIMAVYLKSTKNIKKNMEQRAFVIEYLKNRGIACSVHYTPLHRMPYYRDKYKLNEKDFPVTDDFCSREISLPFFPAMKVEQVQTVAQTLREAFESKEFRNI
ncbi:MAG: DegT/DnrJ/EryC1/StrS family aminotransferase, partial [bacterium]